MLIGRAIATVVAGSVCTSALGQTCTPEWSAEFADGHLQWKVYSLASFDDDGAGPHSPALYAGGLIFPSLGAPFSYVGRWATDGWEPLGQGVDNEVHALHAHDDGSGDALFVGGMFDSAGGVPASAVAKWDGAAWQPVGSGMTGDIYTAIERFATFDEDGAGPQPPRLFAGGHFSHAGTTLVNCLSRWDGSQWSAVGGGVTGGPIDTNTVTAMIVHDDGTGAALFVGGLFAQAGGQVSPCVARWTGSQWQALGSGFPVTGNHGVLDFAVFDPDHAGPLPAMVHAAGYLVSTTILNLGNLARWTGTEWQSIAGPAPASAGVQHPVQALQVWDDDGAGPNEPALFAAGRFTNIWPVQPLSTIPYRRVAKWTGEGWEQMAGGIDTSDAFDLMLFDPDGAGAATERLLVAGEFTRVGGATIRAEGVAQWSGADWSPLGRGLSDYARALLRTDPDGPGPTPVSVIAAGSFTHAAQARVNGVAVRVDEGWQPLGAGFDNSVFALAEHDPDGPGGVHVRLIAGGDFMQAAGAPAARLAVWDGVSWQGVGGGIPEPSPGGVVYRVYAVGSFDADGPGPAPASIYVGGLFNLAGSTPVKSLARWNGSSWDDVGGGVAFSSSWGTVRAFATFDDGNGSALYVGGAFSLAGGQSVSRVGRWNGTSWSPLGTGMNSGGDASAVRALAAFDDGTGNALYAGGTFTTAGGVVCNRVARWDGRLWTALGAGIAGQAVNALAGVDLDGAGPLAPSLFVGGEFTGAGGLAATNFAWWDGATWTPASSGTDGSQVLALLADPTDRSLYAAGDFYRMDGTSSGRIARLTCEPQTCYPDCNADRSLTVADFGCFQTKLVAGDPYADCNQDGLLSVADFGCFQTKFVVGCP